MWIFHRQHRLVTIPIPESFINFTRAHSNGSITSHYVNYIINIFTRFSLKKFYVDVDFMCPVLYVRREFRQTIWNGKEMYISMRLLYEIEPLNSELCDDTFFITKQSVTDIYYSIFVIFSQYYCKFTIILMLVFQQRNRKIFAKA